MRFSEFFIENTRKIEILEVNTSPEIDAMIRHVTSQDATGTLPLF